MCTCSSLIKTLAVLFVLCTAFAATLGFDAALIPTTTRHAAARVPTLRRRTNALSDDLDDAKSLLERPHIDAEIVVAEAQGAAGAKVAKARPCIRALSNSLPSPSKFITTARTDKALVTSIRQDLFGTGPRTVGRHNYNIVGDSLSRRFAHTLHCDGGSLHAGRHGSFAAPHFQWSWAPKIADVQQHLKDPPWVNVVMLGIHDVYWTMEWSAFPEQIQRVCQRDNVLWRLAPNPWCLRSIIKDTFDMNTIRDRVRKLDAMVRKYCGAKAFKVKWIWDPGNTCEHFGAAYRALEIDALEKRVEKEKEKEVG